MSSTASAWRLKSLAHSMPRQVIRVLEILITQHAASQFLRSDKGPEFVAQALQQWLADQGIQTFYVD